MQICPSVLESTMDALAITINRLSPFYNYFQIDIADGVFVPNKTLQIEDILSTMKQWDNETINKLVFDFHLMVQDYETEIKKLSTLRSFSEGGKKSINIKNIFIHYSAISNFKLKISNLSDIPIGLTLNPEDKIDDLVRHYTLASIPSIQIMSVTPGVQGNPFLPDTLKKIEQLRLLGYRNKIYLDGAVNDKTLPFINEQKFKPDVICPGSFLTKANNLKERVQYLKKF